MKPILALDGDGVLVDFTTPALAYMNGNGFPKTLEQVTNWSVFDNNEELESAFKREVAGQPWFCRNMQAYPGAVEFARAAQEEYDLMIVTAPYDIPYWYEGRRDWMVDKLGISRKNVCFLSRKEFFDADILVDDKVENIEGWAKHQDERRDHFTNNSLAILMDQPWNQVELGHGVRRATSFKSIAILLEESGYPLIRGRF